MSDELNGLEYGDETEFSSGIEFQGKKYGTGCRTISQEANTRVMARSRTFPDNLKWDKKDIKEQLTKDKYLKLREKRRKRMLNQGQMNKCNASALKGASHQVRESAGLPFVELSDCWTYMHMNGGVDQGSALADGATLSAKGQSPVILDPERNIKFPEGTFNKRQVDPAVMKLANSIAPEFATHELYVVPDNWEDFVVVMATAAARDFPIIHAYEVADITMKLNSSGFIRCGRGVGNHANYFHTGIWHGGESLIHLDNVNSWGLDWGDGGYGLMTMEDSFRHRKYHLFYVLTSINVDKRSEL